MRLTFRQTHLYRFVNMEGTVKIDISDLEAIVNEILIYCSFNTII